MSTKTYTFTNNTGLLAIVTIFDSSGNPITMPALELPNSTPVSYSVPNSQEVVIAVTGTDVLFANPPVIVDYRTSSLGVVINKSVNTGTSSVGLAFQLSGNPAAISQIAGSPLIISGQNVTMSPTINTASSFSLTDQEFTQFYIMSDTVAVKVVTIIYSQNTILGSPFEIITGTKYTATFTYNNNYITATLVPSEGPLPPKKEETDMTWPVILILILVLVLLILTNWLTLRRS